METLKETLDAPRPTTYKNWEGIKTEIKWPKGNTIARCGDVFLIQQNKRDFAVVYGLQVVDWMDRESAAAEFGQSCIHQANCESLTK